jgi:SGNH domain (fused to AT3 domains)
MTSLRALRIVSAIALLQIALLSFSSDSFASSTTATGPTLAQLISYVVASSHMQHGPNVFTSLPTLQQASGDIPNATIPSQCYPTSTGAQTLPTDAATACAFGDVTATKTIFLFGDSQAAMWLPALNVAGEMLQWKIVFVARTGCGPWINLAGEGTSACNAWVRGEIALANQLKPQVVIPDGLTVATMSNNQYPTTPQFETSLQSMVKALAPSQSKILFFQEIPQFYSNLTSATPESCLTVHSSSIEGCELTVKEIKTLQTAVGLEAVAKEDHLQMVPIRELFCGTKLCDVFVKSPGETHLVYQDWAHMNATYSAWIGRATAQLLATYLPG